MVRKTCRMLPALAAAAAAATVTGPPRAAEWDVRLGLYERYDDNIIQLSDTHLDRLDRATDIGCDDRFAIESAGDFVTIPDAALDVAPRLFGDLPTTFGFDATAYQYLENPVKSYQDYGFSITQPLHARERYRTRLRLAAELVPEYYLRNLISGRAAEETGVPDARRCATYRKTGAEAEIEQVLVPDRLRLEATWGREQRDYNHDFDERDSTMPYGGVRLVFEPRGDARLRLRAEWRREDLHAGGDLADTGIVETDISNRREILAGDVRVRWGRRNRRRTVRFRYEAETRDFRTSDPNNIYHYGRHDDRRYLTLTYRADLGDGRFLGLEVENDRNRSDFPGTPGGFDPDDVTNFDQNLFTIGFGWDFGGGVARRPEPVRP